MWDFTNLEDFFFFYASTDLFNLFHAFLPVVILCILVAVGVFVWSFVFSVTYSKLSQILLSLFCIEVFWRQTFAFFSRAWLVDTFYTKLERLMFFFNRMFFFSFFGMGLFVFFSL